MSSRSHALPGRGGDAGSRDSPRLFRAPGAVTLSAAGRPAAGLPPDLGAPRERDRPARRASSVPAACLCRSLSSLFLAVGPVPLPRDAAQPHRLLPLRLPGEHGQLPARFG